MQTPVGENTQSPGIHAHLASERSRAGQPAGGWARGDQGGPPRLGEDSGFYSERDARVPQDRGKLKWTSAHPIPPPVVTSLAQLVKNLPACRRPTFDPWVREIPSGGGNGNPLQYSCLENPRDRGAWRAIVQGIAESWERPSN